MRINRRTFLHLVGAGLASTIFPGCETGHLAAIRPDKGEWVDRVEQRVRTVCALCPGGCGVETRLVDGRVVKLDGNPYHPVNRGRLCPLGQAGVQLLYHPDRLKEPMQRSGKPASASWKSLEWKEALGLVAARLQQIRKTGEPQKLLLLSGSRGMRLELWERFLQAFGSPNLVQLQPFQGMEQVLWALQGIKAAPAYDFEQARLILSFGSDLIEAWGSPVHLQHAFGKFRQGRPGNRGILIQIDPRFSKTAAKADRWIPIRPGTFGALALGMAYVLIKEGLYDHDFVTHHTFGFEDWVDEEGKTVSGFKSLVLRYYTLDLVSQVTGVPVERISELAKTAASHRPCIAVADYEVTQTSNGTYQGMAIYCLNALLGSIEREGGTRVTEPPPLAPWQPLQDDPAATKGLAVSRLDAKGLQRYPLAEDHLHSLVEALQTGKPYPVQVLFLDHCDPLFLAPGSGELRAALEKVPLVVSFSEFLDDSSAMADLVLPDCTFLERWGDGPVPACTGLTAFGVTRPVIPPLQKTMDTAQVLFQLASKLGGTIAEAFPWKEVDACLKERAKGLFEARRGMIFTEQSTEAHLREMEKRGWWLPEAEDFDSWWDALIERGGWWDPYYPQQDWGRALPTPSRKFEFFSKTLRKRIMEASGTQKTPDSKLCLPHYEPPQEVEGLEDPAKGGAAVRPYPFQLLPFRLLVLCTGVAVNIPWMLEIPGLETHTRWDSWVEISPEDAESLKIQNGDHVLLQSSKGEIRTRARIRKGVQKGNVHLPFGFGHQSGSRWSKNRGVNPNDLMEQKFDSLSGLWSWYETRVNMEKA